MIGRDRFARFAFPWYFRWLGLGYPYIHYALHVLGIREACSPPQTSVLQLAFLHQTELQLLLLLLDIFFPQKESRVSNRFYDSEDRRRK